MARKACCVRTGVRGGLSRLPTASTTSHPWQLRRLTPFLPSSLDPPALWTIPHYLLVHSSCPSGLSPSSYPVLPSTLSHHQSTFPGRLSSLLPSSPHSEGEVPPSMLTRWAGEELLPHCWEPLAHLPPWIHGPPLLPLSRHGACTLQALCRLPPIPAGATSPRARGCGPPEAPPSPTSGLPPTP